MRSPAGAIGWELLRRHRWGLIAPVGYVLALGTRKLLTPGPAEGVEPGVLLVPFSLAFMYFLAAFSFGLDGDLAARQSIYPARMLTLPVPTSALAGWPMLYGTVVLVSLWLATALFALRPWGVELPLIWPALLAAAFLAWTQALTWMPYGLPGARVIVTVLWLMALDTIVLVALHFEVPEPLMVAFLAPQIPLAYLAARFAVARARRGDVPDWRGFFARSGRIGVVRQRPDRFPSPDRAQLWCEWRESGWSLPMWVGILLPFELALLLVAPDLVLLTLVGVLLTPPFVASFVAATVSRPSPPVGDAYGVTPFLATRPLTSAALVAAKLRMAVWSTAAAWLLVLAAVPLALTLSGTGTVVIERARQGIEVVGTPRAIVLALLCLSGLLAATWKQLVQSLYIGLTGRQWIIRSSLLFTLSLLVVVWPVARWLHDTRSAQAALWNALPWILTALVAFKVSAAAWIAPRLHDGGLLNDRTLVTVAACWLVAVLALYGLLAWLVSAPQVPRHILLLAAILEVPLARLSAAPLALAWNRHR